MKTNKKPKSIQKTNRHHTKHEKYIVVKKDNVIRFADGPHLFADEARDILKPDKENGEALYVIVFPK